MFPIRWYLKYEHDEAKNRRHDQPARVESQIREIKGDTIAEVLGYEVERLRQQIVENVANSSPNYFGGRNRGRRQRGPGPSNTVGGLPPPECDPEVSNAVQSGFDVEREFLYDELSQFGPLVEFGTAVFYSTTDQKVDDLLPLT